MQRILLFTAGLFTVTLFWSQSAISATNTYICAISEVQECKQNESCKRVTPQDVNLAPIMVLDLAKKTLVSASMGAKKSNNETIEGVKATDKLIFLHGLQDEETWSAVISRETGVLTGGINAVGSSFVLFGNCAPK